MNVRAQALRNTVFSSVGIYTEYVLGMLTSIVIARHLGPDGFGAYSLVIWMVAMGVTVTNSGTASAAIKFIAECRGAGKPGRIRPLLRYLRRAQLVFMAVVLLVGGTGFYLSGDHVAPGFDHAVLLGFLVLAVALRAPYMFNIGVAKGFEDFRATAIVALISTPLNLAMVLAAWWLDAPVEGLLAVFVVSSAVFWLTSRHLAARMMPSEPDEPLPDDLRRRVRRHMKLTAMTVTIGFVTASEIEVLFLNLFDDAAGAGHFKVAYQLAQGAALLVPGVFGALLLPMMANALSQGREVAGRRFVATTSYLTLLAVPLVAFGVTFAGPIIELLYGAAYAPAAPVFAVCLTMLSIATASQGGSSLLVSADRQHQILMLVIAVGIAKVGADAWLISLHGLDGAMIAYAAVSLANSIATMLLALRVSGASPEWGRLARIVVAGALAALAALPLRGLWPPLPTLLVGGIVLSLVYGVLSLLLGCWNRGDIAHMQQLHARFAAGRPAPLARVLAWAAQRARGER